MRIAWAGLVAAALGLGPLPDAASLRPGQPAPPWSNLSGTDGQRHGLADFAGKKAVVVVFFANSCPDSLDYEDRLIAIGRDYAPKSVGMVFLNVSLLPDDGLPQMIERAQRKRYPFPYLIDPTQKTGLAYAARTTPTVFVLDRERKVAYRGAVDDHFKPEKATRHYVREALDAVLAGQPVKTRETDSPGCDIDYENQAQ